MSQRSLITGITGFLGGHLAEHALDAGDRVLGVSLDGRWDRHSPEELRAAVPLVAWDLADAGGPAEETRRQIADFAPTRIFHLGGLSVPGQCGQQEPTPVALAVNVEGTRRVLQLASRAASRPRVLLASSAHVYAAVASSAAVVETTPPEPRTPYGLTKFMAEALVREAAAQSECHAVIVRSFQHTGPRQQPPMMLPSWCRQFAYGGSQPVEVFTRDAWLDLSDGRDAVRAYRLVLEHAAPGEAVNIGSGVAVSSGAVLDLLRGLAGTERTIVETAPGRRYNAIADIGWLRRRTRWQAIFSLERTVADSWAWWQAAADAERAAQPGAAAPREDLP